MSTTDNSEARPPMLYIVSLQPDVGYEQVFNDWYDTEHLPELMTCPGFRSARRYECAENVLNSPRYLATYLVDGPEVFQSERYLSLRRRTSDQVTPLARAASEHRSRVFIGKYNETLRLPAENSD
jgi:hypothetical protein